MFYKFRITRLTQFFDLLLLWKFHSRKKFRQKKEKFKKLEKKSSLVSDTGFLNIFEIMEKSNQEPRVIDYNSDSDEFSDAIDTHEDIKGDDDFFDVPEWRETKAEKQGKIFSFSFKYLINFIMFEYKSALWTQMRNS